MNSTPLIRAGGTGLTQAVMRCASQSGGMVVSDVAGYDVKSVSATCSNLCTRGVLVKIKAEGRANRYFSSAVNAANWRASGNPGVGAAADAKTAHIDIGDTGAGRPTTGPRINRLGTLDGAALPFVYRPGALDHIAHPSRFSNCLVHRDGRIEHTAHGCEA
ncbi:MAG: hypothetical protein AB9M53_00565 [Leptothrix sp. (in: b-proteobacteria)]